MTTSGSSQSTGSLPAAKSEASSQRTPGSLMACDPEEATIISQRPPQGPVAAVRAVTPFELSKQLAGERLNHFQLLEYVGGGGMGAVFRALDTMLNREVALKVLSRDQGADEETRRRFQNEAQSAARLDHENIARVYYVGEDRGLNYIVFEFIEGVNLREVVDRHGPLPVAGALSYTLQVAHALAHACGRDVVHRDIKPSNLIIMSDGRAKLVDMGLARLHQVQTEGEDLTASGVTLGTFDYISPEQARDPRVADVRSDIYSLGCTLYFMLTGRPPFPDGTVLQKLLQHNSDPPPDPREINPSLPAEASLLVSKMLAKDPLRRYQHPSELIADLHRLAEQIGCPLPGTHQPAWTPAMPAVRPPLGVVRHLPWLLPAASLLFIAAAVDRDWPGFLDPPLDQVAAHVGVGEHQAVAPSVDGSANRNLPDQDRRSTRTSAGKAARSVAGEPGAVNHALRGSKTGGNGVSGGAGNESAVQLRDMQNRSVPALPARGERQQRSGQRADGSAGRGYDSSAQNGGTRGDRGGAGERDAASTKKIGDSEQRRADPPLAAEGAERRPEASGTNADPSSSTLESSDKTAGAVDPVEAGGGRANAPRSNAAPEYDDLDAARPRTQGVLTPVDAPEPGTLIVGDGLRSARRYSRLADACAAAKSGDHIELRYDGRREELPLTVNGVQVEVRPGVGYRPIVVFRPNETNPIAFPRSMITVSGGAMKLVDLVLELDLSLAAPSENWSLVELRSADSLTAENCLLTVRNATDSAAAYHDKVAFLKVTSNRGTESMMPTSAPVAPIVRIRLMNCIARGEAAFVFDQDALPFDLTWHNGLLATTERMLSLGGGAPMQAADDDRVRIDLRGVTALARQGFCRILPAPPAQTTRLEAECDGCLFLTDADGHAFLEQSSSETLDRQQARMRWRGDHNQFRGFSVLWQLASSATPGYASSLSYDKWLQYWNPSGDATSDEALALATRRLEGLRQPLHTVVPATLSALAKLDAVSTDGSGPTIGFDVRKMRAWPAAVLEEAEAAIAPRRDGGAIIPEGAVRDTDGRPSTKQSGLESPLPPEMPPRTDHRNDDRGP